MRPPRRINIGQRKWIKYHEELTGLECMNIDELKAGHIAWDVFVKTNLCWLRDHYDENISNLERALP